MTATVIRSRPFHIFAVTLLILIAITNTPAGISFWIRTIKETIPADMILTQTAGLIRWTCSALCTPC